LANSIWTLLWETGKLFAVPAAVYSLQQDRQQTTDLPWLRLLLVAIRQTDVSSMATISRSVVGVDVGVGVGVGVGVTMGLAQSDQS